MIYQFLRNAEREEQDKVLRNMLVEHIEWGMEQNDKKISKEDAGVIADWLIREDLINFEPFYDDANEYFREKNNG
jgi:hypothetical protein